MAMVDNSCGIGIEVVGLAKVGLLVIGDARGREESLEWNFQFW